MSTRGEGATELWLLWKRAHERVRSGVIAETTAAAGVSEPELSVLVSLHESGGSRRQSAIAEDLAWDRTRLSHLLTRMEKRQYVARQKVAGGVLVTICPAGRSAIEALAPTLEEAARRHLLDRLASGEARALRAVLERLLDEAER